MVRVKAFRRQSTQVKLYAVYLVCEHSICLGGSCMIAQHILRVVRNDKKQMDNDSPIFAKFLMAKEYGLFTTLVNGSRYR